MNWLLELPDAPKVVLVVGLVAAVTSIVTKLIEKSPRALLVFIAILVLGGGLGYLLLPNNAERIQHRIRTGSSFRMLLYKKIGDAQPHYGYSASYNSAAQTMTVTGIVAISNEQHSAAYPCKDLEHNEVVLWGHPFYFDNQSRLVDRKEGLCGIIYFDSDVAVKP